MNLLSESWRLNRHLNRAYIFHCAPSLINWLKNSTCKTCFFFAFWWLNSSVHYGWVPSIQPGFRSSQSFISLLLAKPQKIAENEKENRRVLCVHGEHLKSGWAATWELCRWGKSSLQEAAGHATSSFCLLRDRFSLWMPRCFQTK